MSSLPPNFDVNRLKDRSYKGDDFNVKKELGGGPFNNRRCTDVFCCLLFLVFLSGMGFCTYYGYHNGDPSKLVAPIDGDRHICGVSEGYEEYPYLYIGDIHGAVITPTDIFEFGICVDKCPETRDEPEAGLNCKTTNEIRSCTMSHANSYGSYYILNYCVPEYDSLAEDVKDNYEILLTYLLDMSGGETTKDLYDARYVVLGSFGISLVIVFCYIFMMDKCAFYLAWISVALIQISLVLGGFGAWKARDHLLNDGNEDTNDYANYLFWVAVVTWILALAWYIFLACNFQSLRVSIAIIETAADWFADTKRIMLVPLVYFILGMIIFSVWVGCMVCVSSIGEISVKSVRTQTKEVEWDS